MGVNGKFGFHPTLLQLVMSLNGFSNNSGLTTLDRSCLSSRSIHMQNYKLPAFTQFTFSYCTARSNQRFVTLTKVCSVPE